MTGSAVGPDSVMGVVGRGGGSGSAVWPLSGIGGDADVGEDGEAEGGGGIVGAPSGDGVAHTPGVDGRGWEGDGGDASTRGIADTGGDVGEMISRDGDLSTTRMAGRVGRGGGGGEPNGVVVTRRRTASSNRPWLSIVTLMSAFSRNRSLTSPESWAICLSRSTSRPASGPGNTARGMTGACARGTGTATYTLKDSEYQVAIQQ